MKRVPMMIVVLGLVLSACGGGGQYGRQLGKDCGGKPCLTSIPPTAKSPSPSPKKIAPPPAKKTTPPPTSRRINKWKIVINDVNNGYEPKELRAVLGDEITFINNDYDTPTGHSFTGDKGEWDSGIIKPGGRWKWIVDIPPGRYQWHDENIGYLVGGPLEVIGIKKA